MTKPTVPSMIVGVGASAGGLSAFEAFLQGLSAPSDIGYVLVQHLDPNHESELPSILQRVTDQSVKMAADGQSVQAGQIYVIPGGKRLTIHDGILQLADPDDGPGVRTPIDRFLRSLAEDQGSNAACVILSGTGTDGTLGLKAIKEHGGICMVQDPDEAQYPGMPEAALSTDLVDVVAPAPELGERLSTYLEMENQVQPLDEGTARDADPEQEASEEDRILPQIFNLLRGQRGQDFSAYKTATIWRRIRHRMQLLQIETVPAYYEYLQDHPEECWTLAREFLISVTDFFRDPEAFEALAARCLPQLFADKANTDTIRVWVPGCATGEEAYSLLMLLLEHRSSSAHKPSIQVFATDVDEQALEHARIGFYPTSIRADVSEARLKQFFTYEEGGYRVRPELREAILFAEHDLLSDPPFSGLDLVSCRNVLIYLKPETQQRVLTLFHYALDDERYLFLGKPETPEAKKELFGPVKDAPSLYRAHGTAHDYPYPLVPGTAPARERPTPKWRSANRSSIERLHRRLLTERHVPPSVLVDRSLQIVHMEGEVGTYLSLHPGPPSHQMDDVVPRALRAELRAALHTAFTHQRSSTVRVEHTDWGSTDADEGHVQVRVEPIASDGAADEAPTAGPFALVTFERQVPRPESAETAPAGGDRSKAELREQLQRTRHRLEVVTEEYETSNEELLASNEELQSANEELRSTMEALQSNREELQSTNEELVTVNQELKAKIEALNQRNTDIQNLMEATDVGTLYLNTDLELRRYTARATDLFNVIPSDLGRPFRHLSHVFGDVELGAVAEAVLRDLEPVTRELRTEAGDWFKMRVLPYRTVEEQVEGVLMTFFDVTDLKRAEQRVEQMNAELEERVEARTHELEEANEKLQAQIAQRERARDHFQKLFRLGPVAGVITTLDDGTVTDVNERLEELVEHSRDDLLGATLPDRGIWTDEQQERIYGVLRERGRLRNEELTVTTREGESLQTMCSFEVIEQDDAKSVLCLGVNITARKQAEEALREAKQEAEEMNQLKSSFIANMSHEIRTPLTGIIGFADILEEQVEDDETRRHVEYIRKNGRRLLETLDSVLDLARLDADQIDLDPTPVPLADFVDETVALFRQWATDEELELRVSVVEEVGTVRIDQSALQRVLTNLVGNALKFTDEGHVALRVALVDGEKTPGGGTHLRFEVEDTGVGMEDAFLRKLFEEFTQERAGLRRSHEGAGLGLAISRRLVHLMDGRIDVESEPGVGTTFTVWVPYDPVVDGEEAEAGGQPESWGDEGTLHGWRVLVVDDRPEVGLIVEEFLDDFEVVAAQSAKGARRRAAEEDVDLLLLDIQLGDGTDGISLLPTLRETVTSPDRGETVPAIAITAHSLPGDRQRFLDEGFDGYLSKPFTRSDLRKTVERVLRVAHT